MVSFIRVSNGQLVQEREVSLQHDCLGISHRQGNLYITDGETLYHYTVDVRLVRKIYRDTGHERTIKSCAVSPDGDRIYVINQHSAKLVTLSRDGTVISTLPDPALQSSRLQTVTSCLHVTDSGQVLVCLPRSDTILQVDRDGREILAEVVTKNDGVTRPTSVYYSKHTRSLIVGMLHNNDMIVFQAK
ncbi:uncharacterized protein LOC127839045 [Dreissena polymorpha]|uniref:uncharacterized protein LOC127839045 n=1 Tax=Dreissena polymorpha TaxID=45954 RepID=UPI002264E4F5|nr:uncharacterized protein LOC127839045 [Dreissena polymorpha]